MACTEAKKGGGADGACGPVQAGADPDNECAASGTPCGTTGACNGAGACQVVAAGTQCAPAACSGDTLNLPQACNGSGECIPGGTQSCGLYRCAGASCLASCTSDAQCVQLAYCDLGLCLARQPLDAPCNASKACLSGACLLGVCRNDEDQDAVADEEDNCRRYPTPAR